MNGVVHVLPRFAKKTRCGRPEHAVSWTRLPTRSTCMTCRKIERMHSANGEPS